MDKIWEKRDDETGKAFESFCIYRDMLPSKRSLEKTCQQLGKTWESYHTSISIWSSQHNWVKRAAAWDKYRDQQTETERLETWKEFNRNTERFAQALLAKAAGRLREIENSDIPAQTLSKWVLDGLKMFHDIRGEPTEVIKHEVTSETTIEHKLVDKLKNFLTDDELDEVGDNLNES
jgi:hypothetical protein